MRGVHTADTTAPTVSSAAVADAAATKIVLTFDETPVAKALNAADFSAVVGGSAATLTAAVIVGDTIVLTVSTAITNGQVVTVSYTASETTDRDVADAGGNVVVTFATTAVTNNVAAGMCVASCPRHPPG